VRSSCNGIVIIDALLESKVAKASWNEWKWRMIQRRSIKEKSVAASANL